MPSLPGDLAAPFNPQRNADGVLPHAGRASFALNTANQPRPSREAQTAVSAFTVSSDIDLHSKSLRIGAWGYRPFSDAYEYDYLYTPLTLPYDLALYKQRAGAGSIIQPYSPSTVTDLGSATHPGYVINVSGFWAVGALPQCDTEKTYDDGPAGEDYGGGDECDVSTWGPVTATGSTYVYPSFRGYSYTTLATPFWAPTSNTFAERNPAYVPEDFESPCPGSDQSVTLSSPCVWADLVATAGTVMASSVDAVTSPGFVWGNTGDEAGGTDGTRYMAKTVGFYRWQNRHATRPVRIAWRETVRKNTLSTLSGLSSGSTDARRTKLARTELTEPMLTPYYDEWGAWAPGNWLWEDAGWRQFNWAVLPGLGGSLGDPRELVNGDTGGGRPLGSRMRVMLFAPAPAGTIARVTLQLGPGATPEVNDLPIAEGERFSTVLERTLVGAWSGSAQLVRVGSVAIYIDGALAPSSVGFVSLVQQRRALRIAGHAALISGDQLGVPARWRVKTRRTEWQVLATTSNGPEHDAGHAYQLAVTGEASLETVEAFDAATGEALPMTTTRDGELNGEEWNPLGGHASSVSGTPTVTNTETLSESVSTPAATSQFLRPVGRDEPDPNGEVLSFTDHVEDVPAASYGAWNAVNPSTRGASVFIENRRSALIAAP